MFPDPLYINSQKYSQDLFLKDDERELIYGQADIEVSQLVNSLYYFLTKIIEQSSLSKAIVIALLLPSGIDYSLTVLACYRLRKVKGLDIRVLPLNPHKPANILNQEIEQIGVDLLINDFPDIVLGTNCPSYSMTELRESGEGVEVSHQDNRGKSTSSNTHTENDSSPFIYLFTSGSSGKFKVAVFSWDNWMMSAKSGDSFFPFRQGDRWLHLLPFYHVSGMSILFRTLLHGAAIIFTEKYQKNWRDIIQSDAITHISLVPAQIKVEDGENINQIFSSLKSLKIVLVGGGPIPNSLIPHLHPHTPLRPTYGLTEAVAHVAIYDRTHFDNMLFVKILPSRRVKVKSGEILIHKDSLFLGYLKGGKVIQTWEGEWFPTGDIGEVRGDYLTVKARKDRQFISGGENIYPEEIERIILDYPGTPKIIGVVVFPVPHERWGMVPVAVLDREKWTTDFLDTLRDYLKGRIEVYKVPHYFFTIPKSFNNFGTKLSYQKIEEAYHKGELEKIV